MRPLIAAAALALGAAPAGSAGLPLSVAQDRARRVRDVRYDLALDLRGGVRGRVTVRFDLQGPPGPLSLDFRAPAGNLLSSSRPVAREGERLVFQAEEGPNELSLEFVSPGTSLHRDTDYVYTLFVPDRASEAFPCFDQPDLKARLTLTLDLPEGWTAVANSPLKAREGPRLSFAETPPLSAYLFAFAAGRFAARAGKSGGRSFRLFHLPSDAARARRQARELFGLHAESLAALEQYLGRPYPFAKLDFVLLPAFPFRGMEHPGAIFYRSDKLLLEDSASQEDRLGRAGVIAHEVAHMWFGNLATMRWFDDVWTKESFANLMADKVVGPMFPELDHDLRFLAEHSALANAVDRGAGAHPLHQELPNLRQAGLLYGDIVYHKSPFVLRQLEAAAGEEAFRRGLQAYFGRYAWGNASWEELVGVLDEHAPADLKAFSRAWVGRAGRPVVETELKVRRGRVERLILRQEGGVWPQRLEILAGGEVFPVRLDLAEVEVPAARGLPAPDFVLPNFKGDGYGRFRLDRRSLAYALERLPEVKPPRARAVLWEALHEAALAGDAPPVRLVELAARALRSETEELVLERAADAVVFHFWLSLSERQRRRLAPALEAALWPSGSMQAARLKAYRRLAFTPEAAARLLAVAEGKEKIPGLKLSETDRAEAALAAAVRGARGWEAALSSLKDPELKRRADFLLPAASADPERRLAFFSSLRDPANRRKEPWVLDGLKLLHHPLRAEAAEALVLPALELLEEIQRTGDIFFAQRWAKAVLEGHRPERARKLVERFLASRPEYPLYLKRKLYHALPY